MFHRIVICKGDCSFISKIMRELRFLKSSVFEFTILYCFFTSDTVTPLARAFVVSFFVFTFKWFLFSSISLSLLLINVFNTKVSQGKNFLKYWIILKKCKENACLGGSVERKMKLFHSSMALSQFFYNIWII